MVESSSDDAAQPGPDQPAQTSPPPFTHEFVLLAAWCCSLHAVGLVQRVVEEGLREGGGGGEGSQRRGVDGGRGGRGRRGESGCRVAGGEAVAEVARWQRRGGGVGVLLQRGGGVVAVGGAVVQVGGREHRRRGAELGLQHQAGLHEGLGVNTLLGQPAQTEGDGSRGGQRAESQDEDELIRHERHARI